ncbi:MAG: hypothetical protein K5694_04970 [Bacilli bacterium]|nr:hypothetical protein [Bacilli bacterium]
MKKLLFSLSALALLASCGGTSPAASSSSPAASSGAASSSEVSSQKEAVDMTKGVYNAVIQKYELLIKFYENNVYYMHNENLAFKGIYEIREEAITYAYTNPDGSIADTKANPDVAKWITGTKAIYFYQADGVTPIDYAINTTEKGEHNPDVVLAGEGYAAGTPSNALAYDEENDKIMSLHGVNFSRTITHVANREWTEANERDIIQAKYMPTAIPEGAPAGAVESDYYLTLSQKGYQTNIPALNDLDIAAGKFVLDDDGVYNLTDTISGATATLVTADGGATVTVGETEVGLVVWAEVGAYAALLQGDKGGELRLNEDGTVELNGSISITGNYQVNASGELEMTLDENPYSATYESGTIDLEAETITVVISLVAGGNTMTMTFTGPITGELYVVGAKELLVVNSDRAVYADNYLVLTFFDNCELTISMGGVDFVTGNFAYDATTHRVSFTNVDNGTLTFALGQTCTVTWSEGELRGTPQEDFVFSFEGAKLAELEKAKVPSLAKFVGDFNGNEVIFNFLTDNSLDFTVGGRQLATAKWAFDISSGSPAFEFTEASAGEFSFAFVSQTEGKFNWYGDPGAGMSMNISATFALSELAVFML